MDPLLYLSMFVIALALALAIVARVYSDKVATLKERVRELESSKQSLSTVYGRITEQWAPFMSGYPYDPRNFRFLGSPIDGVQFEEDRVIFVEFKANRSTMTPRENKIRQQIEAGRVEWLEFRLQDREGRTSAPPPPPSPTNPPPSENWGADRAPPGSSW